MDLALKSLLKKRKKRIFLLDFFMFSVQRQLEFDYVKIIRDTA